MTQNTSFDFTAAEVLEALTQAINQEFRYTGYKPSGEAISVTQLPEGGLRVEWGEKPEATDDVPYMPAPTPAAPEA